MNIIYKYMVDILPKQTIVLPYDRQILDVNYQGSDLFLWAMVNTDSHLEEVDFIIVGTGHEFTFNPLHSYLKTIHDTKNGFVWHLFEARKR